jgi:hypothetical protein
MQSSIRVGFLGEKETSKERGFDYIVERVISTRVLQIGVSAMGKNKVDEEFVFVGSGLGKRGMLFTGWVDIVDIGSVFKEVLEIGNLAFIDKWDKGHGRVREVSDQTDDLIEGRRICNLVEEFFRSHIFFIYYKEYNLETALYLFHDLWRSA